MNAISSAVAGIDAAQQTLDGAAARIAQWGVAQPADSVSLSGDAVALMQARNDTAANLKVIQMADAMTKTLLDITG